MIFSLETYLKNKIREVCTDAWVDLHNRTKVGLTVDVTYGGSNWNVPEGGEKSPMREYMFDATVEMKSINSHEEVYEAVEKIQESIHTTKVDGGRFYVVDDRVKQSNTQIQPTVIVEISIIYKK